MTTLIKNKQVTSTYTMPAPYHGTLKPGQTCVVDSAVADFVAAAGGTDAITGYVEASESAEAANASFKRKGLIKAVEISAEQALVGSVIGAATETAFGQTIEFLINDLNIARRKVKWKALLTTPTHNAADTWTVNIKLGSTTLYTSGAVDVAANSMLSAEGYFIIRTVGTGGTMASYAQGWDSVGDDKKASGTGAMAAIDTTAAAVLSATGTCSSAHASMDIRLVSFCAELMGE